MFKYLLAFRYLRHRPINLIGTVGIAVAVWALIVVFSIFTGYVGELVQHVRSSTSDLAFLGSPELSYAKTAEVIEATPGVRATAPRIVWFGLVDSPRRGVSESAASTAGGKLATNFFQVLGIDVEHERRLRDFDSELTSVAGPERELSDKERAEAEKRQVSDVSRPFWLPASQHPPREQGEKLLPGLLMGDARAKAWGLVRGDIVTVTTSRSTGRRGGEGVQELQLRFVLAGTFHARFFEFENASIYVEADVLRQHFEVPDRFGDDTFDEIGIALDDPDNWQPVRNDLEQRLRQANFRGQVAHWGQRDFRRFLDNVEHQRSLMFFVLQILMGVATFLVLATLRMMVSEKTRDIGILAALGATRRGTLATFVICGLVIAVAGVILGLLMTWLTLSNINALDRAIEETFGRGLFPRNVYGLDEIPYSVDPVYVLIVVGIAIAATALFSLIPAWSAARLDPVQALRRD